MSNIVVMNKNTVSKFKSKRTPEQNRSEIIEADFKEIPEVVINPKKSSGNSVPEENIHYEYDGGKIARGIFDDFVKKWINKIVDKFMK